MNPAERLIVALDVNAERADDLVTVLGSEAGVSFFKVGPSLLLQRNDYGVTERIARLGHGLFLDPKLYDTRDTIQSAVKQAFSIGARFVTVHATPSVMEAAMRAKPADPQCKVLAVPTLTDRNLNLSSMIDRVNAARAVGIDGITCPCDLVAVIKHDYPDLTLVSPGIRPASTPHDDHMWVATPTTALRRGADYLVVGRPITAAPDPVAAARAIIKEMEGVYA